MKLTFHGAVREVTGSMHLLSHDGDKILLDCGMFQGRRSEAERKNRELPVDPREISHLIVSHAHIDHSGRIPLFTSRGFAGRIICTRATADACRHLLMDSAHIQESDAEYLNYKSVRGFMYRAKEAQARRKLTKREIRSIKKGLKKGDRGINTDAIEALMSQHHLTKVEPLYTQAQAEESLTHFEGFPYEHAINIGKDLSCTFYDAGHILGSAFSMISGRVNGATKRVCYTGDVGRFDKPILEDPTLHFPEEERDVDLLIMESTYGNREHGRTQDIKQGLARILKETVARGGVLVIPSFSFGRSQELMYVFHELYNEGAVPKVPIYLDSPLASRLTEVFGEHPEVYDDETHETFLEQGKNPFSFHQLHFVGSRQASMALMRENKPHVVISASGMCEAGRILHHLRYRIHNPKNTVLVVGFMAAHTMGRRMLDLAREYEAAGRKGEPPSLKFFNKEYPLRAQVAELSGFSAHADRQELLRVIEQSNLKIKRIALVHGEEDQTLAMADFLQERGFSVVVPRAGESLEA